MSRKSLILHFDSLEILDEISDEQAGKLFKAIKSFNLNEDLELDQITKLIFSPFKSQFLRDMEKYKKTCEKRALAGSKGGKQRVANQANASTCNQNQANQADSKNKSDSKSKNKNKSDSKNKTPMSVSNETNNDVYNLFDYWRQVMNKPKSTKLDDKRKKAIQKQLSNGYTVNQIKDAIIGCSKTPHNMGFNERKQKYNDIELICRNASNLDRFIENANNSEIINFKQVEPKQYKAEW